MDRIDKQYEADKAKLQNIRLLLVQKPHHCDIILNNYLPKE